MEEWGEATRSWNLKQRKNWWVKYVAAVAATVAALQAVNTGIEWYAKRGLGLQTVAAAHKEHETMRDEQAEQMEKLAERIEEGLDRLGERVDRLAARRRR